MFNAKVAVDDVEFIDCDLKLPSSECPQVRCGNGVRMIKVFKLCQKSYIGLHKK